MHRRCPPLPIFHIIAVVLIFLTVTAASAIAAEAPREVLWVKAEGIVNPVMAEYITGNLKKAAKERAGALIIELDTPGGLELSMRDIIKEMLSSTVPVVVYVAPPGSRAASAGVFMTYAANVAAMAPGTNIGSAHPVAMAGGKLDETMAKKVENDSVAYIRGIAAKRGRNADWAEKAVRQSVNVTAEEALKINAIDLMAGNREELLEKLDGRKVMLDAGPVVLHTKDAKVVDVEMGFRARLLDTIINPNVAYILFMIGLLGIYFELANPGAVFPGVIGAVCLVLAFYAFQTLSINYAGLLLIGLSIVFFIIEVKVTSYGLLTIAGILTLILGSLMLFESPAPFMRLSIWVILPTIVFMSLFILGTMYYAVTIHRRRPVSGMERLIGAYGEAAGDFGPDRAGKVFIEGEYWNATSDEPVKSGERVKVVESKGMVLKVQKAQ